MSYGWPQSDDLTSYDLATIQFLYGVPADARASDDTFDFGDGYVWDGAGHDTLSAGAETAGVHIDLRAGSWNWVGTQGHNLAAGQVYVG